MSQYKFNIGEKVLCHYREMIYEAKIIKSQQNDNAKPKYFVHYIGWNQRFDEWLDEDKILEHNEDNLKKQQEANQAQKTKKRLNQAQESADTEKMQNKRKRQRQTTKTESANILAKNVAAIKRKGKDISPSGHVDDKTTSSKTTASASSAAGQ